MLDKLKIDSYKNDSNKCRLRNVVFIREQKGNVYKVQVMEKLFG